MGLRFSSEFKTIKQDYYKVEIHDADTASYGPDIFVNGNFNGVTGTVPAVTPLSIGDEFGGGFVFHIASDGEVFVCAADDLAGTREWGCFGTSISASEGTVIGTGATNTAAIASSCSENTFAAKSASDSTAGQFSDWYLPSRDELEAMYDAKSTLEAQAGFTDFSDQTYWSSSQDSSNPTTRAHTLNMYAGNQYALNKNLSYAVRLVRSFIPFGPFITYGTPTNATVSQQAQLPSLNAYCKLQITSNNSNEGVRFDFPATAFKVYELEFGSYGDSGSIYISGTISGAVKSANNLNGESKIVFQSINTETIRVYFRANNNSASGGTTFYKNIRIRERNVKVENFTLRGKDGFKLSYSGSDTTYDLIKPSTLNFTVNVDSSDLEQLAKDIASSSPERFTIRVYRADISDDQYPSVDVSDIRAFYELYWVGYINKRVMSIKDMPYPFDLNIAATDGILNLKGLDYKQSDGSTMTQRRTVLDMLSDIATKLDTSNAFDLKYDQALMTRVNWYEDNMSATSIDPCSQTWLYVDQFTTVNSDGVIKYSSYYDVLESICRLFQSRFLFSDGRYTFIQFENLTEDTIDPFIYNKEGLTAVSFPSTSPSIEVNQVWGETEMSATSRTVDGARSGFFQRTKTFGNKITNVQIPFQASVNKGNLLDSSTALPVYGSKHNPNVPFSLLGPDLFGAWESDSDISFEFTIKMSVLCMNGEGAESTPDFFNDLNGRFYLPIFLKAHSDVSGDSRWWKPSSVLTPTNSFSEEGSWVDDSGTYLDRAIIVKSNNILIRNTSEWGTNTQEIYVTFNTTVADSSDFDSLHLYFDNQNQWMYSSIPTIGSEVTSWFAIEQSYGAGTGDTSIAYWWEGYSFTTTLEEISLRVFQGGSPYVDIVTNSHVGSAVNSNQNNPELLVVDDIMWGDGPTTVPVRAIYTGPSYMLTSQSESWKLNGAGTGKGIHTLISDEILLNNYLSAEVLQSKIIIPTNPSFPNTTQCRISPYLGFYRAFIDNAGSTLTERYAFTSMSFNPNMGEWAFKGKKIGNAAPTISSDVVFLGTGLSSSPASTSSGSTASQIANNTLVTLTSSVNPSAGAITSVTCTALPQNIPSGSVIQMQSSGSEAIWEQVTLSGDHSQGATTLSFSSWTPVYTYLIGAPVVLTTGAVMAATTGAAGNDQEVQYNDNGELKGAANFKFDDSAQKLSCTEFYGKHTGYADTQLTSVSDQQIATTEFVHDVIDANVINGAAQEVPFNYQGGLVTDSSFKYDPVDNVLSAGSLKASNIGDIFEDQMGYWVKYLTPNDFVGQSFFSKPEFNQNGSFVSFLSSSQGYTGKGQATFQIPKGFEMRGITVKGSSAVTITVYESSYSSSSGAAKASGYVNTFLNILPRIPHTKGNYVTVFINTTSYSQKIYGASINLYPL